MATCIEKMESREITYGKSARLVYTIKGYSSDTDALDLLRTTSPAMYAGLKRQDMTVEPVFIDINNEDKCIWIGRVNYAAYTPPIPETPETGDSVFSFDTTGGTQHITQSLRTVARYPYSATDYKGAIGVTDDSIEGVDITVPVYAFTETHYLDASIVTSAYKRKIFDMTGRVNNAVFRGFAEGECLFMGASGSRRGLGPESDWEITFRFAAMPNRTNMTIGDITGINKKGWEYLWVRYRQEVDIDTKVLRLKPIAVYIEAVYESGDFSQLLIGI